MIFVSVRVDSNWAGGRADMPVIVGALSAAGRVAKRRMSSEHARAGAHIFEVSLRASTSRTSVHSLFVVRAQ